MVYDHESFAWSTFQGLVIRRVKSHHGEVDVTVPLGSVGRDGWAEVGRRNGIENQS